MENFYSFILSSIFCSMFMEMLLVGIIFKANVLRRVLLNTWNVIILSLPSFFVYNFSIKSNWIIESAESSFLSILGLFLFPITFSFLLKNQYLFPKSKNLFYSYVISLFGFILFHLLIEYKIRILIGTYIVFFLTIFYTLFRYNYARMQKIYVVIITLLFCLAVYGFKLNSIKIIISICSFLNIATLFMILFNFRKRISDIVSQSANLNELNKKLTHTITRLRLSGEQWRKIIIEKDLEIFQLARHSSLAELTTGIAHELSQPLTGIKGIAQNMIDDVNFEEFDKLQGVSDLTKICHLVDKSSSIIDHIRNFSRKNIFSLKPIDLNQTILEALELVKTQLDRNRIDLVFVLEDSIPRIYGDKISLEQLILNMILNSKDAIKEKSGENSNHQGVIRIATTLGDSSVILKIEDNGIGIPGDIIDKIWSPFFTTKDRAHGTGVGLSISNKIIKEHNAKVNISSDSNGTIFAIQFPIYNDEKL